MPAQLKSDSRLFIQPAVMMSFAFVGGCDRDKSHGQRWKGRGDGGGTTVTIARYALPDEGVAARMRNQDPRHDPKTAADRTG